MSILLSSFFYAMAQSPEEIIEEALERHQVNRSIQRVEMILTAKNGAQQSRSFELKLLRTQDTLYSRLTFTAPSDISGTIMILADHPNQEDPQLLYLPALQRTQRISGRARKGAFMGSDFQYSDLEYSVDGAIKHELIEETDTHWLIQTQLPPDEAFPYRKSTILKGDHMLSKMEYLDKNKTLLKTLEVQDIRNQDGVSIPFQTTMHTHTKGTKTELRIKDIELNVPEEKLPLSLFAPESLPAP